MLNYFKGLWLFITVYVTNWFSAMSGALTVVAAFIATYAPSDWAKIAFSITALVAFIVSANHIWQQQRTRVIELEDRVAPKLKLSFTMEDKACVIRLPTLVAFRIRVENISEFRITECRGHLKSISTGVRTFNTQSLTLPFSPSEWDDAIIKDINKTAAEFLDFFTIMNNNQLYIHCHRNHLPNGFDQSEFFRQQGVYVFDISVSSKEAPVEEIKIQLNWLGSWETAYMEVVRDGSS